VKIHFFWKDWTWPSKNKYLIEFGPVLIVRKPVMEKVVKGLKESERR